MSLEMADLLCLQFPLTMGWQVLVSRGETCSSGVLQPTTALHMLTASSIVAALTAQLQMDHKGMLARLFL